MTTLTYKSTHCGPDSVACLSLSNKLLASGFENGSVYIWSPEESRSPICLLPSTSPCTAVVFSSPSRPSILYSAFDGSIALWDLRKISDPMKTWPVSEDEINSIDPLVEENCLAIADDTGAISLVSATDGKVQQVFRKHDNICSAARFRPNWHKQLVSAGLDCRLFVSDWKSCGRTLSVFEMGDLVNPGVYADLLVANDGDVDDSGSVSGDEYSVSETDDDSSLCEENPTNLNDTGANEISKFRVASSFTPQEVQEMAAIRMLGHGLPLNPPMIHALACSDSGARIAVGLGSGTVEVFQGAKHLRHVESLFGHRRGVSALLALGDSKLVSGGNDCSLFVWGMASDVDGGASGGVEFIHNDKINVLAGQDISSVYIADNSAKIQIVDLTRA